MLIKKSSWALVAALVAGTWAPRAADACWWQPADPIEKCLHAGGDVLSCVCVNGGPCEGAYFTVACGDDCPDIDPEHFEDNKGHVIVDFYDDKGNLLYEDKGVFVVNAGDESGAIQLVATGNLSRVEFDANYRAPKTTILNRSDLTLKVSTSDGYGKHEITRITGNNVSYSHALWCEHSGDSADLEAELQAEIARAKAAEAALSKDIAAETAARVASDNALDAALKAEMQARINGDYAEAAARKQGDADAIAAAEAYARAADDMINGALAAEVIARQQADDGLGKQILAESIARSQGDTQTLASANAYTDARTPWPQACAAGQEIVSTGAGWKCDDDVKCPAGDANTKYYLESAPGGTFVCRAFCSDTFVDPQTDKNNCGGCGVLCGDSGQVANAGCSSGKCVVSQCNPGYLDCDGAYNDGCECSIANGTPKCGNAGACVVGSCNAGYADCDGAPGNGCEAVLGSDNANCGACGVVCNGGMTCTSGVCGAPLYNFSGVITNTPKAKFTGWKVCLQQDYGQFGPSLAQIQAQCNLDKILYTCSNDTAAPDVYQVAAWGHRADVFFVEADMSNQVRESNNAYFYFNNSGSMGFSPNSTIYQQSADTTDSPDFPPDQFGSGAQRISWHTGAGNVQGGWRCGNNTYLNAGTDPKTGNAFSRYILQAP
jgi:hypothetical protein